MQQAAAVAVAIAESSSSSSSSEAVVVVVVVAAAVVVSCQANNYCQGLMQAKSKEIVSFSRTATGPVVSV